MAAMVTMAVTAIMAAERHDPVISRMKIQVTTRNLLSDGSENCGKNKIGLLILILGFGNHGKKTSTTWGRFLGLGD